MKVFVTGGSGLVGSTIIDMLLARGDEVLAIDNFATGRRDNLAPHPKLRLVEDSIADRRVVDALVGDFRPDVVIHTAASYKDPDDWEADALTNCVGTANVARACKDHKVDRLIYFQTALVLRHQAARTADHAVAPDRPGEQQLRDLENRRRALHPVQRRRLGDVPAGQCRRPAQCQRPAADLF